MARKVGHLGTALALLLIPGTALAQTPDRAQQLEARQSARLQARQAARADVFGLQRYDRGPHMGCDPRYAGASTPSWLRPGYAGTGWAGGGFGSAVRCPTSGVPPGLGYTGDFRGYASGGYGYAPGDYGYASGGYGYASGGYGYGRPGGFRWGYGFLPAPPNPYRDWARLWGRGWLDDEPVPPYHRFQYRFFPETLPDPTEGGYVTAEDWYGSTVRGGPVPMPAGPDCVRIELERTDREEPEVFAVRLPALGAGTADALRAVIGDRLRRGGGVVLRAYDGHVVRFPPAESIHGLHVAPCAAP
jgi:hypothetical protein